MPARSSARPPEARSRHGFTFIPVRHGPLPERDTHSEQGDLRHLLSAAVMTLAAEYPDGLARRGTVAVLAAATGVLLLTVTVTVWGRAWTAVAAALARAAAVHWIAAWLITPAMARGQTGNQLRRIGLDAYARRT
jgi:hypothetical protein